MVMSFFGSGFPDSQLGTLASFSLVVVGIAALNLVLDFDFTKMGLKGLPTHGVGQCLGADGHAGVAVHRTPAFARQITGSTLND